MINLDQKIQRAESQKLLYLAKTMLLTRMPEVEIVFFHNLGLIKKIEHQK